MTNVFSLNKIEKHFKEVMIYAPGMLLNDSLNFFLDRFKEQAWLGTYREPWQKRKQFTKWGETKRNNGRAILILSGKGRRSIRITRVGMDGGEIGTDMLYMKAHNEGMRLGLIQSVRSFERKVNRTGIVKRTSLSNRTKIKFGKVSNGTTTVKAHTRRIDQRIPRRQFMGNSPYLEKQLQRRLTAELMKGLR